MDNIEIKNLVPQFVDFFEEASSRSMSEEKRFELWKDKYNFAAVPPGGEGEKIARSMLADSWHRYAREIDFIKEWKPEKDVIEKHLSQVKQLLGCEEAIDLVIIYFVGSFEGNYFIAPYDNRSALCLPIESELSDIVLYHELTHIVHHKTAGLNLSWERPVGALIMEEGLATRVSRHFVKDCEDEAYIEYTAGWLDACRSKKQEIINGIIPYINDSSSESVMKFTFGSGNTGLEREGYYVGWKVVQSLSEKGVSYEEMAKVPEEQIPQYVQKACESLYN
ncbi:DUF2268 domain-containing putative Zn-dependent protease [Salinicoccus sp. HZC-1]|uniref:DUF2268 domain-containing putative Zn-dependent protease n=1 Tax=Salinicoccus sp. HZC-1 TaxID=3385497 RepID=UPI00398AA8D0